jgi:hypothetical protein
MGWEHVELALESTRYVGVEKMAVVVLCHFINKKRAANGDTVVWPGMKTLIRMTGWTKSPVQRAIDKLVADKDPVVEIVSVGVGSESTHYRIHLDRLGSGGELTGVVAESQHGSGSEVPTGSGEPSGVVAESYPNHEVELGTKKKEDNQDERKENVYPSSDVHSSLRTNPKQHQPRPTLSTPEDPAAPSPISPKTVWEDWTREQRDALFSNFPEGERSARKLETLFSFLTGKPSSWKDFNFLMTSLDIAGPYIGSVIVWAVKESGHWEFHNSKHFCKSTVWPVLAQQYDQWKEKKDRELKKAHGCKPSLTHQRNGIGLQ